MKENKKIEIEIESKICIDEDTDHKYWNIDLLPGNFAGQENINDLKIFITHNPKDGNKQIEILFSYLSKLIIKGISGISFLEPKVSNELAKTESPFEAIEKYRKILNKEIVLKIESNLSIQKTNEKNQSFNLGENS